MKSQSQFDCHLLRSSPAATAVILSLTLLFCGRPASAELFVIDQSATPFSLDVAVVLSSEVAQTFTPSLSALDFIDVGMVSMDPTDTGTFQVHLRGPLGDVIGFSDPVYLSTGERQMVHFTFPDTITLSPGDTYQFTIPHSGPFWGATVGSSTYDRGSAYLPSWPADQDFWFREGIVVPEPAVWRFAAAACALFCLKRKFTSAR